METKVKGFICFTLFELLFNYRTYRLEITERVTITDISIHYNENMDSTIKLGYLSVGHFIIVLYKNNKFI
jgi:hypothetical protein